MVTRQNPAIATDVTLLLDRFEAAWQSTQPPNLNEFLLSVKSDSSETPAERRRWILELIPIDLECRWRRFGPRSTGTEPTSGDQTSGLPTLPSLRDYAAEIPELGHHLPASLLVAEYLVRRKWGDWLGPGDWSAAYPAFVESGLQRIQQAEAELARERVDVRSREQLTHSIGQADGVQASTIQTQVDQSAAPSTPILPGEQLGDYRLLSRVGKGGMGEVFKAEHVRMKRVVALKVLARDKVATPEAIKRFEREVIAVSRLRHPNIVEAHDAREHDGTHFLVMEFVPGIDLYKLVQKQGPLSVKRAVELLAQAARGLSYAHAAGVVHRDLKPSNLLLAEDGTVKVLDLGLARIRAVQDSAQADEGDLTADGDVMGTVDYMAPEQALSAKTADERSDVYSLGATLFFLLTGKSMYAGESALERILAHQTEPIPEIRLACGEASCEIQAVFNKMVAKIPQNRYQSMAELISALERCAQFAGDNSQSAVGSEGKFAGSSVSRSRIAYSSRRWQIAQWIGAAAAGLVVLLAAVIIVRNRQGEEVARITVPEGSKVEIEPAENVVTNTLPANRPVAAKTQTSEEHAKTPPAQPPIEARAAVQSGDIPSPASALFDKMAREDIPAQMLDPVPKDTVPVVGVFGGPPLPHWGTVRYASLTPSGDWLVTAGSDGSVRVWNTKTKKSVAWIRPSGTDGLYSCRLSDDGQYVVSVLQSRSFESEVGVFELHDLRPRTRFEVPGRWRMIHSISPDGRIAVLTESGTVNSQKGSQAFGAVLDLVDRKIRHELVEWAPASAVRSNEYFAWMLVSKSSTCALWDLDRGAVARELSCKMKQAPPGGLSPKGTRLVIVDGAGQLVLWDVERDLQVGDFGKAGYVSRVCWLGEERPLILQDMKFAFDPMTGTKLELHFSLYNLFEIPNSQKLVSASGQVSVVDAQADKVEPILDAGGGPATDLKLAPDDRWLAFRGGNYNIYVVDLLSGKEKRHRSLMASVNWSINCSASGDYLAAGGYVWNTRTWTQLSAGPVGEYSFTGCFGVFCDERLCGFLRAGSANLESFELAGSNEHSKDIKLGDLSDVRFIAFHPHRSQILLVTSSGAARSIVVPSGEIARSVTDVRMEASWVREFMVSDQGTQVGYWEYVGGGAWMPHSRGDQHSLLNRLDSPLTTIVKGGFSYTTDGSSSGFNTSLTDILSGTCTSLYSDRYVCGVAECAWTRDHRYLITANNNGTVYVLRPHSGMKRPHFSSADALAVLPRMSPTLDGLQGQWRLSEGGTYRTAGAPALLRIPVDDRTDSPFGSAASTDKQRGYEIDVAIRFSNVDPSPELIIGLVLGKANPQLVLDRKWTERLSGLEYINFERVDKNVSRSSGSVFEAEKVHRVKVQVVTDGKRFDSSRNWTVEATVDGRSIVNWKGPENHLSQSLQQLNLGTPTFFIGTSSRSALEISSLTFTSLPKP